MVVGVGVVEWLGWVGLSGWGSGEGTCRWD